jgi:hypothetical protein
MEAEHAPLVKLAEGITPMIAVVAMRLATITISAAKLATLPGILKSLDVVSTVGNFRYLGFIATLLLKFGDYPLARAVPKD